MCLFSNTCLYSFHERVSMPGSRYIYLGLSRMKLKPLKMKLWQPSNIIFRLCTLQTCTSQQIPCFSFSRWSLCLKKKSVLRIILIFPSPLFFSSFLSAFTTWSNYFPHHNLFLSPSIIWALYLNTHTLSNTDIHPCLLLFLASEGLSCLPPTLLIGSLSLSPYLLCSLLPASSLFRLITTASPSEHG